MGFHHRNLARAILVLLSATMFARGAVLASEAEQTKPPAFTMPEVLEILNGQGYEKFRSAERVGDEFIVVAKSVGDRRVRLRISAQTGEVLEEIEIE